MVQGEWSGSLGTRLLLLEAVAASLDRRFGRSALIDFFDYLRARDTFSLHLDSLGVQRLETSFASCGGKHEKNVLVDVAFDEVLAEIEVRFGLERSQVNELLREALSKIMV